MFDNDLIKYYKNADSKDGFLNATTLGITHNATTTMHRVKRVIINGKSYYLKSLTPSSTTAKQNADAEVLLSQLYCKFGIDSTIYLPAQNKYGKFLICDDVEDKDVVTASSHLYPFVTEMENNSLPFLINPSKLNVDLSRILTQNAMIEQTKMRVLDAASFNCDRHYANFFYRLLRTPEKIENSQREESSPVMQYFRNLVPNPAKEVVSIDYGISGGTLHEMAHDREDVDGFNLYESDFSFSLITKDEFLDEVKTNEQFAELIDKKQLAEDIGNLNPSSVAEDIKQTIGYSVDPKVVDVLTKSYDDMAETLLQ